MVHHTIAELLICLNNVLQDLHSSANKKGIFCFCFLILNKQVGLFSICIAPWILSLWLFVCMGVFVCMRKCDCVWLCVFVCMHNCVCVCVCVRMRARVCACRSVSLHVRVNVFEHVCVRERERDRENKWMPSWVPIRCLSPWDVSAALSVFLRCERCVGSWASPLRRPKRHLCSVPPTRVFRDSSRALKWFSSNATDWQLCMTCRFQICTLEAQMLSSTHTAHIHTHTHARKQRHVSQFQPNHKYMSDLCKRGLIPILSFLGVNA